MIRTKLGLLVLCLVVLSTAAFSASAAQAETGAKWLVLKTEGGALLTDAEIEANNERFVGEIENKTASFLFKVLGIKAQLLCTAGELIDALLAANGSVKSGARAKFSGCVALKAGTTEKLGGCFPHSSGQTLMSGIVETNTFHVLMELHELAGGVKHVVYLVLPDNFSEEIANLLMGEECAIGAFFPIFGKATFWDCEEEGKSGLKHKVTHLITEFKPLTKMYVLTDTVEHLETSLDGSGNIKLASGRSWASKPN